MSNVECPTLNADLFLPFFDTGHSAFIIRRSQVFHLLPSQKIREISHDKLRETLNMPDTANTENFADLVNSQAFINHRCFLWFHIRDDMSIVERVTCSSEENRSISSSRDPPPLNFCVILLKS